MKSKAFHADITLRTPVTEGIVRNTVRMGAGGKERRPGHRGADPRKRNEPGGGEPAAAKRGKAAEQGKQAASGGKGFLE